MSGVAGGGVAEFLAALARAATLSDYNTRVVVAGVTLLGMVGGMVGAMLLLRKRALLADVISHATLPGVAAAFLISAALGGTGKSLPMLLAGATTSGLLGVLCVHLIPRLTRIREDAALGIVLSVFFAAGICLLGVVQSIPAGGAAGLKSYIYGKTAAMLARDAQVIFAVAIAITILGAALFKELTILCFDADYAAAQGWPVHVLDLLLMLMVVAVTVIGLQAVGLILVIAMLVIPPAAARFWTHQLRTLVLMSAAIGAVSGALGALISAAAPRLPSGAIIVLVGGAIFVLSLLLGARRGVLRRMVEHARLTRRVARQHLLRGIVEHQEARGGTSGAVPLDALLASQAWTTSSLRRELSRARRDGLVSSPASAGLIEFTPAGEREARRVTHNHRLWELFLIEHADIAPSHVDRDADAVEHVLDPAMVAELEALVAREDALRAGLPSPHALPAAPGAAS